MLVSAIIFIEIFYRTLLSTSRWMSSSELTPKSFAAPLKAFCALMIAVAEALLITTSPLLRSKNIILSPSFRSSFLIFFTFQQLTNFSNMSRSPQKTAFGLGGGAGLAKTRVESGANRRFDVAFASICF
jgi:hypothetical protein